jgi:hypothetical protein
MLPGSVEARAKIKITFRQEPDNSLDVACLLSSIADIAGAMLARANATKGSLMILMDVKTKIVKRR